MPMPRERDLKMGIPKKLFEKLLCCHDWQVVHKVEYRNGADIILKCKKYGRITKRCI